MAVSHKWNRGTAKRGIVVATRDAPRALLLARSRFPTMLALTPMLAPWPSKDPTRSTNSIALGRDSLPLTRPSRRGSIMNCQVSAHKNPADADASTRAWSCGDMIAAPERPPNHTLGCQCAEDDLFLGRIAQPQSTEWSSNHDPGSPNTGISLSAARCYAARFTRIGVSLLADGKYARSSATVQDRPLPKVGTT
jgi:hypothetical protein